jgi:hypothetical protein
MVRLTLPAETVISFRSIRRNQQHALICTTRLLYVHVLAPTCFGSGPSSSGSFLDPSELLQIQIGWVVYHIMCGYMAFVPDCHGSGRNHDNSANRLRNHTLYYIPPIRFVFEVTQKDLRSSLMMEGYCRNM